MTNIYAQPNPDCGDLDQPPCEEEEIPLDSGVGLLIGAAAFYTIKKIRDKKESNNNASELG